jgi:hypothetical protein
MYLESTNLIGVIPTDEEVQAKMFQSVTSTTTTLLLPAKTVDKNKSMTTLRFRSQGEKKRPGTASAAEFNGKRARIDCVTCGKNISRKTDHPPSACDKYIALNEKSLGRSSTMLLDEESSSSSDDEFSE